MDGSAALRDRCTVLTTSPALAEALVDAGLERALAAGPDRATMVRRRDRIQVWVPGAMSEIDDIDRLVALGQALSGSATEVEAESNPP